MICSKMLEAVGQTPWSCLSLFTSCAAALQLCACFHCDVWLLCSTFTHPCVCMHHTKVAGMTHTERLSPVCQCSAFVLLAWSMTMPTKMATAETARIPATSGMMIAYSCGRKAAFKKCSAGTNGCNCKTMPMQPSFRACLFWKHNHSPHAWQSNGIVMVAAMQKKGTK